MGSEVKRLLITGERGFIGSHFIKRNHAYEVTPSGFDLLDSTAVTAALKQHRPDVVLHLAGMSLPAACDANPERARLINVQGTTQLVDAMANTVPAARFIFASTAQVYRPLGPDGGVITEDSPIEPINLYAQTKFEAEQKIEQISRSRGLNACILRVFNHVHKSQKAGTFLSSLYQEILHARPSPGQTLDLPVGNLNLYRDVGSIEDFLRALEAIIEMPTVKWASANAGAQPTTQILNVCNGRARKLLDLGNELARVMNIVPNFKPIESRMRANDPERVVGSHARLTQATGWSPTTTDDASLIHEYLRDW